MTDLRKLLGAAKVAVAAHQAYPDGKSSLERARCEMALQTAAVNALPALLDIVEAAQQWQVAWDAIDGPHGINDARRYSEAKNALTAALAKWEKTHE